MNWRSDALPGPRPSSPAAYPVMKYGGYVRLLRKEVKFDCVLRRGEVPAA
jgi:hypothetical protein